MRTIATIAAIALLSGCATPPQQVRTVYVPAPLDPAVARIVRDAECRDAILTHIVVTTQVLENAQKCKKNQRPDADSCVKMNGYIKYANDHDVVDKASACFSENNSGGFSQDDLKALQKRQVQLLDVVRSLPLSVLG
jgi:hypothetical protein